MVRGVLDGKNFGISDFSKRREIKRFGKMVKVILSLQFLPLLMAKRCVMFLV